MVHPWASSPKPADLYTITDFASALSRLQAEVAIDANAKDLSRYGLDRPSWDLL